MKASKILFLSIISITVLAIFGRLCFVKIEPGTRGVLSKEFGGGLQERDYGPGYFLSLGPLHTWRFLDSTVQTLNMLRPTPGKSSGRRSGLRRRASTDDSVFNQGPLQVKSADGADVKLDITIKYRIKQDKTEGKGYAWRIIKEFQGEGYKKQVRSRAIKTLQLGLGRLETEDFFDPTRRKDTQRLMVTELRDALDKMYVDLVSILIRDLSFSESYERKIKEKTLAEQRQEVNVAKTAAAEALGETNKIIAETGAKVAEIRADLEKTLIQMRAENDLKIRKVQTDAERYVLETQSDADLFARQKEAEGVKLLKDAEARGEALKREALSIAGGNTLVALRLIESLRLGDMMISTQALDPLDIDGMMKRLGAGK